MARPTWKGAVSFGLVTIPIALYTAVERKERLSFRLLHEKDQSPVDYRRFCATEDVEIPWSEIVKGYEYEKGHFVVVTDDDFARARVPATDTFEIHDFVPVREIEPVYFDEPYYVAPSGKGAGKAYALLRDALAQTGRVGIGTIVLRQREHLGALAPVGEALVLTTLRYAHEIRPAKTLELPAHGEGYAKREMDLGLQLVESLAGDWRPTQYRDTYHDVLLDVIEKKVEGEEVAAPPERKRPARVVSLAKALEASLRAPGRSAHPRTAGSVRRAGARASSRRQAPARRARRRAA